MSGLKAHWGKVLVALALIVVVVLLALQKLKVSWEGFEAPKTIKNTLTDAKAAMAAAAAQGKAKDIHLKNYVDEKEWKTHGYADWWGNNSNSQKKVVDGADAAQAVTGGAAQSQCAPVATAEPAHPMLSKYAGMGAAARASAYPDESAANALAGKTTYSCAPDVVNAGASDYALNPDNLMPGSWREGVACSEGTDPNSQWAKYHPTREKYYRYITAAGSARLSANTRSSTRKILGLQNPLRSATATPLTAASITPFHESSHRAEAIHSATGSYPQSIHA